MKTGFLRWLFLPSRNTASCDADPPEGVQAERTKAKERLSRSVRADLTPPFRPFSTFLDSLFLLHNIRDLEGRPSIGSTEAARGGYATGRAYVISSWRRDRTSSSFLVSLPPPSSLSLSPLCPANLFPYSDPFRPPASFAYLPKSSSSARKPPSPGHGVWMSSSGSLRRKG
jgi:hypothetical protein